MKLPVNINMARNLPKVLHLGDQALVSGTNFLTGVLITKALGLAAFGTFTMGWLVLLFASSIQQAWIIQPMYSLAPKMPAGQQSGFNKQLYLHQVLFSIAAALLVLLITILSPWISAEWDLKAFALPIALLVFFFMMQDFYRKRFFLEDKLNKVLTIDIIAYVVVLAGLITGMVQQWLTLASTWWIFIAGFSAASFYGLIINGLPGWNFVKFNEYLKTNFKFSGWLIASSLLQWFSGNFFILAAGSLLGPVALGAIRIGQNVLGVLNVVYLAMENKVPIVAARIQFEEGNRGMIDYLKRVGLAGIALTAVIVVILSLFSRQIITALYGTEYENYAWLLAGFGVVYLLVSAGMPLRFALRTLERTRDIFYSYVLSVVFSLAMANYMVSAFGIAGVIAGLAISQLIMSGWYLIVLNKKLRLS